MGYIHEDMAAENAALDRAEIERLEGRVEELEALIQQTHGVHVSWVARVTELEAEARAVVAAATKDAGFYRVPRRELEFLADLVAPDSSPSVSVDLSKETSVYAPAADPRPSDAVTEKDWKEAYLGLLSKVRDAVDYHEEQRTPEAQPSPFGWWARFENVDGDQWWLSSTFREPGWKLTEDPEQAYQFASQEDAREALLKVPAVMLPPIGIWHVIEHKDEGRPCPGQAVVGLASEEVARMVHAFGDPERKQAVRDLAARVRDLEQCPYGRVNCDRTPCDEHDIAEATGAGLDDAREAMVEGKRIAEAMIAATCICPEDIRSIGGNIRDCPVHRPSESEPECPYIGRCIPWNCPKHRTTKPVLSPTKTSAEAYRKQHAEMCRRALEYLNSEDREGDTGADAIATVARMLETAWNEGFEANPCTDYPRNKRALGYRAMVVEFVKCMVPHPKEHPTMHAAWTKGKTLLESDPCEPEGACETHGRCWRHSEWEETPEEAERMLRDMGEDVDGFLARARARREAACSETALPSNEDLLMMRRSTIEECAKVATGTGGDYHTVCQVAERIRAMVTGSEDKP